VENEELNISAGRMMRLVDGFAQRNHMLYGPWFWRLAWRWSVRASIDSGLFFTSLWAGLI
jgi:hypothetical protein